MGIYEDVLSCGCEVILSTLEWPPVTCMTRYVCKEHRASQRVLLRRQVAIVRAQTNELKSEVRRLQAWLSSQTDMIESTLSQAEAVIDRDCGLKETSCMIQRTFADVAAMHRRVQSQLVGAPTKCLALEWME